MKIRNIIIPSLIAILAASCSPIDKNDYLIYVEPELVSRAVLIEDFTGQKCVNCPEAVDVIEQLVKDYGEENIVAVGIHSMPLGFAGTATNIGLMNDESKAYGEYCKVEEQPCGLINHVGGLQDRDMWPTLVSEAIKKQVPVSIEVNAQAKNSTDIDIKTICTPSNATAIDAKLQLWLIEDSIKAMQSMPDGTVNREYIHNHVFRSSINGMGGEAVKISGVELKKNHTFTLSSNWVPKNCSVVAFLYNDNEGVIQVTKAKVKTEAKAND